MAHFARSDSIALLNEVVGGFRLESLLGSGTMGVVFLASHQTLGRRVALKVLRQEHADDGRYVSRFFREAKVVNAIRHPNIVDVFDFVETRDPVRVAYVMEYIGGPTLSALLKKGRLSVPRALNLMEQLADALSAVHAVSVVHRDLKPSNILIVAPEDSDFSLRPSVKITDFGICKITESSTDGVETATGMILGTPSYMAPEQIVFDPVTSKTDVYALGEILYEMLVGKRLFGREIDDVFRKKLERDPIRVTLPQDLVAERALRELIEACVAYHPEDRPSAQELGRRCASIRARISTMTMAAPRAQRPPKRSARGIALWIVGAGFIFGLVAALLILPLYTARRPIVARNLVEPVPIEKSAVLESDRELAGAPVEASIDPPKTRRTTKKNGSVPFKRRELPAW